jgi:hypothetical protein
MLNPYCSIVQPKPAGACGKASENQAILKPDLNYKIHALSASIDIAVSLLLGNCRGEMLDLFCQSVVSYYYFKNFKSIFFLPVLVHAAVGRQIGNREEEKTGPNCLVFIVIERFRYGERTPFTSQAS